MTKRSPNFERRPQDKYYTPTHAIDPLLPYLPERTCFIEPCAGDGRIVNYLSSKGHQCALAIDVAPEAKGIRRMNALDLDASVVWATGAKYIITNPPWDRPVLHTLIRHLIFLPMWLLFDADWMHTEFWAKYGGRCSMIVSVGRVKWIEGSANTGFDNCCWYHFGMRTAQSTRFYGRES